RPLAQLAQPRLVPAGSPDPSRRPKDGPAEDVTQIVMSRDGSEGWAIGPDTAAQLPLDGTAVTLYHYDGSVWSRCDMHGVPPQLPPDPACSSLAPLYDHVNAVGKRTPLRLLAAARVPYENDSDPSNDN